MLKRFIPLAVMLSLTACEQVPVRDEESPMMRIPPGSMVTLHEALAVPAGHARVFLQNGKVVAKTRLNTYYPHCNFEVRQVSDGRLQIEPDTFIVTTVVKDEEEWVSRQPPLMHTGWRVDGLGEPVMLNRLVHHRLHSPRQPQVMRLTCHGGFDEAWRVDYPSISEIRKALGARVTLKLATGN